MKKEVENKEKSTEHSRKGGEPGGQSGEVGKPAEPSGTVRECAEPSGEVGEYVGQSGKVGECMGQGGTVRECRESSGKVGEYAEQSWEVGEHEKYSGKTGQKEGRNPKELTACGFLPDFSKLENCFNYLNRRIKYGRRDDGESKEGLIEERERLLKVVKEMDMRDLWILYYVKCIEGLGKSKMLRKLKKFYEAERRFWEEF